MQRALPNTGKIYDMQGKEAAPFAFLPNVTVGPKLGHSIRSDN